MTTNILTTSSAAIAKPLSEITSADIEKIETAEEAANLAKVAEFASRVYKFQDDRENSQKMKKVYIMAARHAGTKLLPENLPREIGGDRKSKEYKSIAELRTRYQEVLDGAGITESQSKKMQYLAKIEEDILENYFNDPKYMWDEYTIKGLLSFAFGGTSRGLTLEGALKKFQDVVTYIAVEYPDAIDEMRVLFEEIIED